YVPTPYPDHAGLMHPVCDKVHTRALYAEHLRNRLLCKGQLRLVTYICKTDQAARKPLVKTMTSVACGDPVGLEKHKARVSPQHGRERAASGRGLAQVFQPYCQGESIHMDFEAPPPDSLVQGCETSDDTIATNECGVDEPTVREHHAPRYGT